jgi:murein DD-endopeptidase MepM/ murein hydrolase activator NlpD
MKKIAAVLLFAPILCFAFKWPQDNVVVQSFSLGFSEIRESAMSQSLIFEHNDRIKAAGSGTVVAVIEAPESDSSRFYSTLGNAAIVNHGDGLVSVYGNLDEISIAPNDGEIAEDTVIGLSGSSGWHQGPKGLEFQVLDIKNRKALNPRALMPRFDAEEPLFIPWVTAVNKQNEPFTLGVNTRIPAGQYKLYVRGNHGTPYKTTVFVNGAIVETITYDALGTVDAKLTVRGKSIYATQDIFPAAFDTLSRDKTQMYLSTVTFSHARNIVRVVLSDINNVERQADFTVDAY